MEFSFRIILHILSSYYLYAEAIEVDKSCTCGQPVHRGRIAGGEETSRGSNPWFASIWVEQPKAKPKCGATVINNLYLLTAAHCVVNVTDYSKVTLLFDHYDVNEIDTSKRYSISKIIIPPTYNSMSNDIALLRLAKPLNFDSDPSIRPACLPDQEKEDLTEKTLTAIGFGQVGLYADWSRKLLKVDLPYYETDCEDLFGKSFLDDHICARDIESREDRDVCVGDSGGPLLFFKDYSWQIVGITSHGNCVGSPSAVFARVSYYLKWIVQNTRDAVYCSSPPPSS